MDQAVDGESESSGRTNPRAGGFPWYVKVALAVVILVILFVIGIDLLEFVS
ncbi:hypothetical protein [Halorarius halobius]|uniref:hypothetical protein n=1 Tax=Halorarius halobius TaxID=2962671 RepID=UPI0020CD55FE|nr:hypothetical protein [Halorarius halobius]